MGNSLTAYIQQLELIAFFAGYPIMFILVQVIARSFKETPSFFYRLQKLLPFAYALAGTLYLGLTLNNTFHAYRFTNSIELPANPLLTAWALFSLLFYFKFFRRKSLLAFLHSLVFFFLFAKDIFLYALGKLERERLVIDMKLYSDSLLLNCGCLLLCYLVFIFWRRFAKNNHSANNQ
jgi:hypothetical protein